MTTTQRAIYEALASGSPHSAADLALLACCEESAVKMHVCNLRKLLRTAGADVSKRGGLYRLVRVVRAG